MRLTGHLTILCDYGLDDAIATVDLLSHAGGLEKIDILAVGGNMPADVSLRNARTLLCAVGGDDRVRLIDTCAVRQNSKSLFSIHGADGMGGFLRPDAGCTPVISYADWQEQTKHCDYLLSLGPMTLTAQILKKTAVGKFFFMAGCIDAAPNFGVYEFNHGMDPAAFSVCTRFPHAAVTLDIACPALNIADRNLPSTGLYYDLMRRYRELCAQRGENPCCVWDDIAVRYLLYPELFSGTVRTDRWGNSVFDLHYVSDIPYPDHVK